TSRCVQNSWLPFSAGCIQRQERKRTNAADSGRSEVTGPSPALTTGTSAGTASTGAAVRSSAAPRRSMLLLKLDANGFLQRAKCAQFFWGGQRQRAPG